MIARQFTGGSSSLAVRLAFGVVADRDRRAWLIETGEEVGHDGPEGAAVVLGARDSDPARVAIACADLAGLVEVGGTVIAGAGIDLGEGFVSARLAGATGDRRDAVIAALRVLKLGGAWRLGERTATLVALFGVAATKPVGAAAEQAIGEGRWAAVILASAAADVLGPEQLVRVLALRTPDGVDPMPEGVPSVLAANLRRVLEQYSGPRRLELVLDLWEHVCAGQLAGLARARLAASHDLTVLEPLRERYRQFAEAQAIELVENHDYRPFTVLHGIQFRPTWRHFWKHCVERLIQDALAATALLRAAVAVHELGADVGIARVRGEIEAVSALFTRSEINKARRPVGELTTLPARPIGHLREIDTALRQQQLRGAAFERFLRTRLRTALAYATIVRDEVVDLFRNALPVESLPETWDSGSLRAWRAVAGYPAQHPPQHWHCEPLVRKHDQPSLADRLAEDASAVDRGCDLLWLADLADAMARALGHAGAVSVPSYRVPVFDTNPPAPQPDPLTPRAESIPLAVAGAAQLLALGAAAPDRCRDWVSLCEGLMRSGAVAQALTSEFDIAEAVLAHDGAVLPGTGLRIQFARTAGRLAEWSDYMGNCIAGPWYQREAVRGRSILLALRDERDVIVVNAELRRGRGWLVNEIAGRFNRDPDPAVHQALREWAATLPVAEPQAEPADPVDAIPPVRVRRAAPNPLREVAPLLRDAAGKAMIESEPGLRVLTALAGDRDGDPKSLTALRRSPADRLGRICANALAAEPSTLPRLWTASGTRPLAAALEALDPALLSRYPRLTALRADAPIPSKTLRAMVKDPDIAIARTMDLVGLRLRAALGRLARADDPALAHALTRNPLADMLCPLIISTTLAPDLRIPLTAISEPRAVTVPGYPVTSLSDPTGPWQTARVAARELGVDEFGSDSEAFWTRIADHGLRIPASWLGPGGWPALWSRAHSH